jgi:spore coat polysaccharide biosynthesis predicted glycosyltransferase SpsG
MRSSVLAEEAISRGYECIFVGRILDLEWVTERISNMGFTQVLSDYRSFKANSRTDVLVIDSYSIPVSNEFIAKNNWKFVLSICDQITPKYASDMELRPGFEKIQTSFHGPVVLSGIEYLLIRQGIEKSSRKRDEGAVTKLLIVGGGSDPFGFVPAMAHLIALQGLHLEMHLFSNDEIPTTPGLDCVIHPIGSMLDYIANQVDVVFTTASTSSLEFIAREIPTGVVCAVGNQAEYFEQLGRLGYATQIGHRNPKNSWEFNLPAVKEMLESQHKRDSLKEAIHGLIDHKGAARVIDILVSLM